MSWLWGLFLRSSIYTVRVIISVILRYQFNSPIYSLIHRVRDKYLANTIHTKLKAQQANWVKNWKVEDVIFSGSSTDYPNDFHSNRKKIRFQRKKSKRVIVFHFPGRLHKELLFS